MSTISAQTEFIRFTVTQPHQVNISARGLRMGPEGRPGRCIEGDIEPVIHANVEYRRVGDGPLSARLVAPPGEALVAILQTEDGHTLRVTGTTYLQTDKACAGRTSSTLKIRHSDDTYTYPLPIWGDVSIGSEGSDVDPGQLLNGTLAVSARSVEFPLFKMRKTLYPVSTLDLTVGSRVEAFAGPSHTHETNVEAEQKAEHSSEVADWWGVAFVDDLKPGLSVEVATETRQLAVFHPTDHEPDVIEVTEFTEIFNDPNLVKIYKVIATFVGVVGLASWLAESRGQEAKPPMAKSSESEVD